LDNRSTTFPRRALALRDLFDERRLRERHLVRLRQRLPSSLFRLTHRRRVISATWTPGYPWDSHRLGAPSRERARPI
jgi:hypothetical protein